MFRLGHVIAGNRARGGFCCDFAQLRHNTVIRTTFVGVALAAAVMWRKVLNATGSKLTPPFALRLILWALELRPWVLRVFGPFAFLLGRRQRSFAHLAPGLDRLGALLVEAESWR